MKKLVFLVLLLLPMLANAQMLDPTKWTVKLSKQEVKLNQTVEIIFTAVIDKEWKLYALGDNPPQATFTIEGTGFQLVGKMKEGAGVHQGYDDILEMDVRYFEGKAEFKQTVKITKKNPVINIELEGQACPKGPGQCVRVNKSFTINEIKVVASQENKESGEVNKVENANNETKNNSESSVNNGSTSELARLEDEREQYITRDSKGNDETVIYLKSFVNKYGRKK